MMNTLYIILTIGLLANNVLHAMGDNKRTASGEGKKTAHRSSDPSNAHPPSNQPHRSSPPRSPAQTTASSSSTSTSSSRAQQQNANTSPSSVDDSTGSLAESLAGLTLLRTEDTYGEGVLYIGLGPDTMSSMPSDMLLAGLADAMTKPNRFLDAKHPINKRVNDRAKRQ